MVDFVAWSEDNASSSEFASIQEEQAFIRAVVAGLVDVELDRVSTLDDAKSDLGIN